MPMPYIPRHEQFTILFPHEPAFRWNQIMKGLFTPNYEGWKSITTIPKSMQTILTEHIPWFSLKEKGVYQSARGDTYKALLSNDAGMFESVLMQNKKCNWTICASSQIGCAMKCTFCATGKMGFQSNLSSDHIIDQYRFWQSFLHHNSNIKGRISNMVFMGMGEPLANYENVKTAIQLLLKYTDLGKTKITISTVGVIPLLEKLLVDNEWPHVRMAISVHSADANTRKKIVPTSFDDFLDKLAAWGISYQRKFGNRKHHLTFEYVMLNNVNDSNMHAEKLAALARKIGNVKINLIPYNYTGNEFACSTPERFKQFMAILKQRGVTTMRRKTMGDDISAACGQLMTSIISGSASLDRP